MWDHLGKRDKFDLMLTKCFFETNGDKRPRGRQADGPTGKETDGQIDSRDEHTKQYSSLTNRKTERD